MTGSERKFAGKVCVVTGGAQGIGMNTARLFAQAGARVWICDIDEAGGRRTTDGLRQQGGEVSFVRADLASTGGARAAIDDVFSAAGRIDVLVNNAKAGQRLGLLEETPRNWEDTLRVMLDAVFFASQAAIRHMKESGGGSVVNVGSVAGSRATLESPSYHVAKSGIQGLTRYLAAHAGPWGIRVNSVEPGLVVKDEHRARFDAADNRSYRELAYAAHPMRRAGSADEIAQAILFLASGECGYLTGQSLVVDGGLTTQDPFALLYSQSSLGDKGRGAA